MIDYEYDEPNPWGFGTIVELGGWDGITDQELENLVKQLSKRMSFIGFYENKEKNVPYMTNGKRNYKKEDEWDKNHPGRTEDRAERHKARAMAVKEGKAHKGDGKDVDHKTPLSKGGKTEKSNLRVVSASENRSFSRNSDGSLKSQTSKRERKGK